MLSIAQANISSGHSAREPVVIILEIVITASHKRRTTRGAIAAIRHAPRHCLMAEYGSAALAAVTINTKVAISSVHSELDSASRPPNAWARARLGSTSPAQHNSVNSGLNARFNAELAARLLFMMSIFPVCLELASVLCRQTLAA